MTGKMLAIATSALIATLGLGLTPARAQDRVYDRVNVNLPYTVTLGDATLQPGDYVIRELQGNDHSRVLLIYSDNGAKHEATVNTIPAYDNRTQEDTKVVLHHYGPDYYFDRIWIAGKNYGYEFPVPANVKERQREREGPITVAATYQPAPSEAAAAAPTPAPTPAPEPAPPPAENTPPVQTQPATPPAETAQNTPPPPPANEPEPQANRESEPPSTPSTPSNNDKLPATSADWLMMLLGGGSLSGIGLALRRKR